MKGINPKEVVVFLKEGIFVFAEDGRHVLEQWKASLHFGYSLERPCFLIHTAARTDVHLHFHLNLSSEFYEMDERDLTVNQKQWEEGVGGKGQGLATGTHNNST